MTYSRKVYFVKTGDKLSNLFEYKHQAEELKRAMERLFPDKQVEIIAKEKIENDPINHNDFTSRSNTHQSVSD